MKQLSKLYNKHCHISICFQSISPKLYYHQPTSKTNNVYEQKPKHPSEHSHCQHFQESFQDSGHMRINTPQAFESVTVQTREVYVPSIHFGENPIKLKSSRNDLLLHIVRALPYNWPVKCTAKCKGRGV